MSGLHLVVGLLSLALIVLGSIWFLRSRLRSNGLASKAPGHSQIVNSRTKYRSVNATRFSPQIMLFSLAVSMGIVLICLSWTQIELPTQTSTSLEVTEFKEIDVVRTTYQPPKPPPPALPRHIEAVPEPVATLEMPPELIETVVEPTVSTALDTGFAEGPIFKPPLLVVDENDDLPYIRVEQMPRFPGCEDISGSSAEKYKCAEKKLLEYIYQYVKYPAMAREAGIEGPVVVRFVVEKDGSISSPQIIRDIGGGCGVEVKRVVASMNSMDNLWTPGKQRGIPVRVQFTLPVYFKLK